VHYRDPKGDRCRARPRNRPSLEEPRCLEAVRLVSFSANDREGTPPVRPKAEDSKVVVERGRTLNSKAPHNGEAGSIDQGKILILPRGADLPGALQVSGAYNLHRGNSASQRLPKSLSAPTAQAVAKQSPGFNEDVVGRNEDLAI